MGHTSIGNQRNHAGVRHVAQPGPCAPGYIASLLRSCLLCCTWTFIAFSFAVMPNVSAQDVIDMDVEFEFEEADGEGAFPVDPETAKLRAHLAVQRALVGRVCKLTDQQQKKLKSMDNRWLKKISEEKQVIARGAVQQPGLIGMFFGVRPQQPQVIKKQNVQKRIDTELLSLLDEEQKAQYEKELKQRAAFRADATAEALIETLQDRLDLTDEQRAKMKEKMIPWVARQKNLITTYYFNGNNYFPDIPLHLLAALTDEQRKAYQGMQRHLFNDDNFQDGNDPIVIEE